MRKGQYNIDMCNGPLWNKILLFALPLMASSLLQLLFNAADIGQAAGDIGGMFGFGGVPLVTGETLYYLRSYGVVLLLGLVGATPLIRDLALRLSKGERSGKAIAILEPAVLTALLLLCTAYLVDGSFNPFLYFRF